MPRDKWRELLVYRKSANSSTGQTMCRKWNVNDSTQMLVRDSTCTVQDWYLQRARKFPVLRHGEQQQYRASEPNEECSTR